jgi:hypothetical protein
MVQLPVGVQCDLLLRRLVGRAGCCRCGDAAVLLSQLLALVYSYAVSAYDGSCGYAYEPHSSELETYLDAQSLLVLGVVMLISCAEGSLTEAMSL